jgi:hypothetical protein
MQQHAMGHFLVVCFLALAAGGQEVYFESILD